MDTTKLIQNLIPYYFDDASKCVLQKHEYDESYFRDKSTNGLFKEVLVSFLNNIGEELKRHSCDFESIKKVLYNTICSDSKSKIFFHWYFVSACKSYKKLGYSVTKRPFWFEKCGKRKYPTNWSVMIGQQRIYASSQNNEKDI